MAFSSPHLKRLALAALLAILAVGGTGRAGADSSVFFMTLPPAVLPLDVGATAFSIVGTIFQGDNAFLWTPTSGTRRLGGAD